MNLPEAFTHQMRALLPDSEAFFQAFNDPAPVSIRLNPFKTKSLSQLALPWCSAGYQLPERPIFTLDPRLHAGAYYVQDASCMAIEAVLGQLELKPQRILDACAAPGGKSTHLAALYPDSLVIANEVIRSRASILSENASKWGSANLFVTSKDPASFTGLPDYFDLIVADVPCSGEGLFRKDPEARKEWSQEQVELCARRQRRILAEIWPSLKPGGILVYSTCTYNSLENEDQLDWLVQTQGAEPVKWSLPESWPLTQSSHGDFQTLRCYPHQQAGEGFFLALLRKPEGPSARPKMSKRLDLMPAKETSRFANWLQGDWVYRHRGNEIEAWPTRWLNELEALQALDPAGLGIAEIKGKDLRPLPALALCRQLNKDSFRSLELTHEQAIAYLQRQALYNLSPGQGLTLASFWGWSMGWLKQVGDRANNLYPQTWRIRMQPSSDDIEKAWHQLAALIPLQAINSGSAHP